MAWMPDEGARGAKSYRGKKQEAKNRQLHNPPLVLAAARLPTLLLGLKHAPSSTVLDRHGLD
jgi:hypothetical protein